MMMLTMMRNNDDDDDYNCDDDDKDDFNDDDCNTLVLTPFALNVHDVYIVINHGVELKSKSPPLICLCYVLANRIIVYGLLRYTTYIKFCHHVNMHFN